MAAAAITNIFESNAPIQGARVTETAHRRIELQSPKDLTYMIATASRESREKLDRHFPPDAAAGQDDAMRARIEQLDDDYIRNVFSEAKGNLSINGMGSKELEAELAKAQEGEEIEPFDTKLAQRIQALSAQIEDHTLQLANLRRTAPAQTSENFQQSFKQSSERYDARIEKIGEKKLQEAQNTRMDVGQVERLDEVQATWQNGSESLMNLKSGLGGTVAKMEKAQQAVDLFDQMRR